MQSGFGDYDSQVWHRQTKRSLYTKALDDHARSVIPEITLKLEALEKDKTDTWGDLTCRPWLMPPIGMCVLGRRCPHRTDSQVWHEEFKPDVRRWTRIPHKRCCVWRPMMCYFICEYQYLPRICWTSAIIVKDTILILLVSVWFDLRWFHIAIIFAVFI